eukprot:PITA_05271
MYILNRSPTRVLKKMISYEAWYGKRPNVNHFKVFGCLAYVHVPDHNRKKLDAKSGVYGHKKGHVEKTKSILIDDIIVDIDHEPPTNDFVSSGLTPPSNPSSIASVSSSSQASSQIYTRKIRILSDIYQRSANQAHEENPTGETINFALLAKDCFEPSCFEDACTNEVWVQAMQEEMDSIHKNDTWELTELPHDRKNIGTKWVYKTKFNSDESVERQKARFVAKGFTQKYGIDYEETFAPVER